MHDFLQPKKSTSTLRPGWILGLLIISVLSMVSVFIYSSTNTSHNSRYLSITSDLKILNLQLVKHVAEASKSQATAFTLLENSRDEFGSLLETLRSGDNTTGLPPAPSSISPTLEKTLTAWNDYQSEINRVLRSQGVVRLMNEFVVGVNEIMPDLNNFSEDIVKRLIHTNADKDQIYKATRQLMLGQRIATGVNRLMLSSRLSKDAAADFTADTKAYGEVLNGFINGDSKLGIERVSNRKIQEQLSQLWLIYETVEQMIARILEKSGELFRAQNSSNAIFEQSAVITGQLEQLNNAYLALEKQQQGFNYLGYGLGAAALFLMMVLSNTLSRTTRLQLKKEELNNQKTQNAILQLLDEIAPVADGDLTAKATVSEEITGAIADAVNYTIEALRDLVVSINHMAGEVASAAEETQITAIHLARASDTQATQIKTVTESVAGMTHGVLRLSQQAQQSAELANNNVQIAEQGSLAVRNTINSMRAIREDIKVSANKIKRLGESSQEIGDIVELINDIADQTNILALNAAIQASASSEDNSGLANIADEVQQLAERVSLSTQKIESLIRNIQMDTGKAVDSMEQSTADVLTGAKLAETAGNALLRIESVSLHLADFIQKVSKAAVELSHVAEQVTNALATIRNITNQNVAGTKQTAVLTGKLVELASEQRKKVEEFKLPADTGGKPQ